MGCGPQRACSGNAAGSRVPVDLQTLWCGCCHSNGKRDTITQKKCLCVILVLTVVYVCVPIRYTRDWGVTVMCVCVLAT